MNAGAVGGSGLSMRAVALRVSIAGLALVLAMLALPSRAAADAITISLQENGGAITSVGSGIGFASFAGSFGDFTFNSVSGVGSPYLAEPGLQSTSIDVSGASGNNVLNVFVTEYGLTAPALPTSFLASFTSQIFSGSIASVTEQAFIGNPVTGIIYSLGSSDFTGTGTNSVLTSPSLSGTYDETVEYTIRTSGAGSVNDSIQIAGAPLNTPEPSTLLLMGLGLGGLLLFGRRRLALSQNAQ